MIVSVSVSVKKVYTFIYIKKRSKKGMKLYREEKICEMLYVYGVC